MKTDNGESWVMKRSTIEGAREAIERGIENTQELLADFDLRFGRTIRSSKCTAERLESEISQMKGAHLRLEKPDGEFHPAKAVAIVTYDDGTSKALSDQNEVNQPDGPISMGTPLGRHLELVSEPNK